MLLKEKAVPEIMFDWLHSQQDSLTDSMLAIITTS